MDSFSTITAWAALTGPLGLTGIVAGQRATTIANAPVLAGVVEWAGQPEWPEDLLVRLERPAPGIAHLAPILMGGQVYLTIRLYLYREAGRAVATAAEAEWQTWLAEHFRPDGF